jgi:hypothetical protein
LLARGAPDQYNGHRAGPSARLDSAGIRIPTVHQTITTIIELPEAVAIRPHRPWGPLCLLLNGKQDFFLETKRPGRSVMLVTPLYVVSQLRLSGALPPFHLDRADSPPADRSHSSHCTIYGPTAEAPSLTHKIKTSLPSGCYYKLKHFDHLSFGGASWTVRARVGYLLGRWKEHWVCLTSIGTGTASGSGSSVGVATGYWLGRPGIESRWGRDFPRLSKPVLGPTQPPIQRVPGLYRR